jgi:hypothetical protein
MQSSLASEYQCRFWGFGPGVRMILVCCRRFTFGAFDGLAGFEQGQGHGFSFDRFP